MLFKKRAKSVLAFLQLPQDLDLLAPILEECQARQIPARALATSELVKDSPRVLNTLKEAEIPLKSLPRTLIRVGLPSLKHYFALITASESTAGPHRLAYHLTRRANRNGIKTFTLQHGFDNIGLTYFDNEYPPNAVGFASQTIFTWGEIAALDERANAATRARCLAVGNPKKYDVTAPKRFPNEGPLVVIFENLHWTRYSKKYRERFVDDTLRLCRALPKVTFAVKPHFASRWITELPGDRPHNLLVIDPKGPEWEPYSAPALIRIADAVISTPSTVVVDAATLGVPVSVVAYDMNLPRYEPLTSIRSAEAAIDFLSLLTDSSRRTRESQRGSEFLGRWVVPGNGTLRIVAALLKAQAQTPAYRN